MIGGPWSWADLTNPKEYWSGGGMAEEVSIFSLVLLGLVVVPLLVERMLLRRSSRELAP